MLPSALEQLSVSHRAHQQFGALEWSWYPKKMAAHVTSLQALNAASYRETHHTAPPFTQVSVVPSQTVKTTLDA